MKKKITLKMYENFHNKYIYMKISFAKTDSQKFPEIMFIHCAFQLISVKLELGYFNWLKKQLTNTIKLNKKKKDF